VILTESSDAQAVVAGSAHAERLGELLRHGSARIGVVGLGYVGLPLAVALAEAGHEVVGLDADQDRLLRLGQGVDYIRGEHAALKRLLETGALRASSDAEVLGSQDAIILCVPTPLTPNREPDMSFVEAAVARVAAHLRAGQLVVLESTTYPGTTEELVLPPLLARGFTPGDSLFVAYSPERVDPGNQKFDTRNTPKIVGGLTPRCTALAQLLYARIVERVVAASAPRVAEMVKLLENIFRCVNIALVNEMALLARRMDIDIWEVIRLASTKPYGFMPFYPGPGMGGHCIPIDPFYLTWKAREYDFNTRFIELAGEVNMKMPAEVVDIVIDALGTRGKSLRGARVLVLGAAYKRDVADTRESPSLKIIELLDRRGAEVSYNDSRVPKLEVGARCFQSVALDGLAGYDCVVISTDHSEYDFERIVAESRLLVDTRNASGARDKSHVYVL